MRDDTPDDELLGDPLTTELLVLLGEFGRRLARGAITLHLVAEHFAELASRATPATPPRLVATIRRLAMGAAAGQHPADVMLALRDELLAAASTSAERADLERAFDLGLAMGLTAEQPQN